MADATAGKVLYLVLLRMGFVRISALAGMERALTSPFHPYRRLLPRRESTEVVCFLWHFPPITRGRR